jgi:hypothetical protein
VPLRSVYQVEVDPDGNLKKFVDIFEKHREALTKMPAAWKAVGGAAKETSLSVESMAALLLAQNEYLAHALESQRAFSRAAQSSAHHMGTLRRAASGIASSINAATRDLLKWGTITGVAGGLLGLGGLFGIEHLAGAAAGGRKQAGGLGLPYGLAQGFGVEYNPLLDSPNTLLTGMLAARTDPQSKQFQAMLALGLPPSTQDPSRVVNAIASFARRTPTQLLGPMAEGTGISSLVTTQDLMRLQSRNPAEVAEAQERLRRLFELARLNEKVTKGMQDLDISLGEARLKIQSAFIDGLAPLAPELSKLVDAFSNAVGVFLHSDVVKHWIDLLATSLESFAKYMGTKDFEKSVEDVATVLGDFGKVVWNVTKWIASFAPSGGAGLSSDTSSITKGALIGAGLGFAFGGIPGAAAGGLLGLGAAPWVFGGPPANWKEDPNIRKFNIPDFLPTWKGIKNWLGMGGEKALPSRWLSGGGDPLGLIEKYESRGRNIMVIGHPESHASGLYQIEPGTWARYARMVPGASMYSRAMDAPSDIQRAMAQAIYNSEGFSPWESYNPQLRNAVNQMATAGPGGGQKFASNAAGVRIIVENRTGGSATVSTSMLSQVA